MAEVLKKQVSLSFPEAVDRVKEIVSEEFSILMVKSIDEVITGKLNISNYPLKYTTILACGPDLAKMALDVSEDVGSLMPCSFSVYQKEGKVFVSHVSIMKLAAETGIANENDMQPVIEETGKRVQRVWEKI